MTTALDDLLRSKDKQRTTKPSRLAITQDDTKVLGRITDRRREKVNDGEKFSTAKYKTLNSTWTPVVNRTCNENLFKERRELVSHWFDMWTDSQRKRFLDVVFRQCGRSQNKFVQDWFQQRVPLQHLDFSTVLPRFLALYVFSFLEPKSLSRCAQVCWHWKFLADQDVLWMAKCLKYGWFLPYTPPDHETGAWKRHYIACVHTLDFAVSSAPNTLYGTRNDGALKKAMAEREEWENSRKLSAMESNKMMTSRPPWQGPDYKPKDLDKNHYAFLHDVDPNDPMIPKSALLFHNKLGILRKRHGTAVTSKSQDFELGLDSQRRRERHRALTSGEDYDLGRKGRGMTLSESMDLENMKERRVRELVDAPWCPPARTTARSADLSGGDGYRQTMRTLSAPGHQGMRDSKQQNPRLIFISSRVLAADLLLDAVTFGVIPLVYEYEGSTAEALLFRVEEILQGRHAQSIGLFCHTEEPGEIRLTHGSVITLETLDIPENREFFEALTSHILPSDMGGQCDIFMPLAASEPGMELLVQLSVLTGMQFSSPTGIIGAYNHVNTDWLIPYKNNQSPPSMYFCSSKLNVWANTADQASEAVRTCKRLLSPYFEKAHRDIAAQLSGEVVFGVLGQTDIRGIKDLTSVMADGLRELSQNDNVNGLEFLGKYFLEQAGVKDLQFTGTKQMSPRKPVSSQAQEEEEEELYETRRYRETLEDKERVGGEKRRSRKQRHDDQEDWEEEEEDMGEEEEELEEDEDGEAKKDEGTEKAEREKEEHIRQMREQKKRVVLKTEELSMKFGTMRLTSKNERLTAQQYSDHPEKRTPIAFELLSSEIDYNRTLQAIRSVYFKPLQAALKSNRAIISHQNLQIIFSDVMAILDLSKILIEDLKNRIGEWDPHHTCLGDIFVKFCNHLKTYTNFVNNNDVILQCIERSKEQTPSFRAFLKRHDRIPNTKMLTLPELLLFPSRRVNEYVRLLSWFELHTPKRHPDRADLADAIDTLKELDSVVQESKLRMEQDREMVDIQRKVQNCPALMESNRYLVKHLDVSHLKPPIDSEIPELRAFQNVAVYGLFLFNDALMITRRTSRHLPFSRAVEYTYKFESSIGLGRLRVKEVPDSKYVKNAFKMDTPKQVWYCSTETPAEKFNWISLLEQTTRAALQGK